MNPKQMSNAVEKGFAYLVEQQQTSGGWSQGGGWRTKAGGGRVEGPNVEDPADVANTCAATLALLKGGNTPTQGKYSENVMRGIDFVMNNVEQADGESPYVTELRDTQVQTKIGPLVDTFMAVATLAEAKGLMPDADSEQRLCAALDKAIGKVERHQEQDGSWKMHGWAPVVGLGLASAGLNRAREKGAEVSDEVLERSEKYARQKYNYGTKTFSLDGAAGVPLYGSSSHLASKGRTIRTLKAKKAKWEKMQADEKASDADRALAEEKLKYLEEAEFAQMQQMSDYAPNFKDAGYRQGFGSNGGEEFLSYLNISEELAAKGGKDWEEWDKSMTENLERVQNADGSWAGHHCITGRTFCTAVALLVLTVDSTVSPEAAAPPQPDVTTE